MLHFVREAVKEEVSTAVKEQGVKISDSVLSAMRSGAVTPAVSVTPDPVVEKQHVLNLLRQGQLNAAFQQVGSLNVLNSVLSAMRSGAVTPAVSVTPDPVVEKQHVLNLLRQGQLNAAFQQVGSINVLNFMKNFMKIHFIFWLQELLPFVYQSMSFLIL